MNAMDLSKLEAITKDYAVFQARKSGLATALAGVLVLLAMPLMFLHHDLARHFGIGLVKGLALLIYLAPLLWLALRLACGSLLYRGLGEAKAIPDLAYEQKRMHWIFGIGLALIAFQTNALIGYEQAMLGISRHPESVATMTSLARGTRGSWVWVGILPCFYAVAAPWAIRGVEEARAYAVLVAQALIWIGIGFAASGVNYSRNFEGLYALIFAGLELTMLFWAILAVKRGWREHREYLVLLRSLPVEEV